MDNTSHLPDRIMGPRRIAVVPAALAPEKLDQVVDEVVHGDAFSDLRDRLDAGELSPDDLVVTLPAEGGVDVDILDDLQRLAVKERLDALLVQRDRSGDPLHRRLGSLLLSAWATLWAGRVQLPDAASCHRVFRLAALADALDHCGDERSVSAVELAVVLGRLGGRVRNDVLLAVPVLGRCRGLGDVLGDAVAVPVGAFRVESTRHGRAGVVVRLAWPLLLSTAMAVTGLALARHCWRRLRAAAPRSTS